MKSKMNETIECHCGISTLPCSPKDIPKAKPADSNKSAPICLCGFGKRLDRAKLPRMAIGSTTRNEMIKFVVIAFAA